MNLQTSSSESNKKYTVKPQKSDGRTREEFAERFIKSYDGALKRIARGERGKDAKEFMRELKKEIAEDKADERKRN